MFTNFRKEEKGFTLIELLIVVAIIGILAAIAIPQFGAYRVRGYNAAASSDLRNTKIQEEAFKTDWQIYASTAACTNPSPLTGAGCTGAAGTGVLLTGPGTVSMTIAAQGITTTLPTSATSMSFGLSNGVIAGITTTTSTANEYTIHTSHSSGDTIYGADAEFTAIKQAGKSTAGLPVALNLKVAGAALTAVPTSVAAVDDLPAASGWVNM